jgi:hypothetical protein
MNSMLYSIVRNVALAPLIDSLGLRKTAAPAPEVMFPWRHPANPKSLLVFTSRVRALAMDPAQTEAAEGIAITHRAFAELRDAAHANGSKLLIAFIPTKERVYCPVLMREKVALPAHHLRVCEVEPQVTANLEAAARALGIATVQTAPGLEKAATEGALIYPPSADSHPIKAGYTIIARQIADAVKTLAP